MATLMLLKFNNYLNRQLKVKDTIADYEQFRLGNNITNYNFPPNDGISTNVIINGTATNIETADYLLVIEGEEIKSRWYIIECSRTRLNQYQLKLYRDSVADNFNSLLDSPMFIEKATLKANDPMLLNSENMTYNQIKTSETLLKDETGCAWIVGYIPRDFKSDGVSITYPLTGSQDYTVEKLSDWQYYNYIGTNRGSLIKAVYGVYVKDGNYMASAGLNSDGTVYEFAGLDYYDRTSNVDNIPTPSLISNGLAFTGTNYDSALINKYRREVFNGVSINELNATLRQEQGLATDINAYILAELNGKILLDKSSNTYYRITATSTYKQEITNFSNININRNIPGINITGTAQTGNFKVEFDYYEITIKLEQAYQSAYLTIPEDRYHLNDQPYDMFCMPYSDDLEIYKNGTLQVKANKNLALSIGTTIGAMVGSTGIYDVQLLPYCPVRYCISEDGKFDFKDAKVSTIVRDNQSVKAIGYMFWANTSTFTFDIKQSLRIKYPRATTIRKTKAGSIDSDATFIIDLSVYLDGATLLDFEPINATPNGYKNYVFDKDKQTATFYFDTQYAGKSEIIVFDLKVANPVQATATEIKVANECDKYRLCSPNYNGQFEFNLAKNGDINYFNVDCSYKPFNPYIHINPEFGKLYGRDFNDARGLICSGDFSLPQITSAWANYEANNKNYQNIFNRQIQSMEFNNNIARTQEIFGAITGSIGGAVQGGIAGSSMGLVGAGIGAGLGLVGSVIGGAADIITSDQIRNETLDYTKDLYGYNLGNIQAIPYSLSKVGSLNGNNKLWPFIEYYTCTNEEKAALKSKLKYNGMTVMRIGTIREFITETETYIKGKLIRNTDIGTDYNYLKTIAAELNQGLFVRLEEFATDTSLSERSELNDLSQSRSSWR